MDKLLIDGQHSLSGSVRISAAKNSVLPMLCASVMVSDGQVELENVPHLQDVTTTTRLLTQMGVSVTMSIWILVLIHQQFTIYMHHMSWLRL